MEVHRSLYITGFQSLRDVAETFCPTDNPQAIELYLNCLKTINEWGQGWNPAFHQASDFPLLPYSCLYLPNADDMAEYSTMRDSSSAAQGLWAMEREYWLEAIRSPNREHYNTRETIASLVHDPDIETVGAIGMLVQGLKHLGKPAEVGITALEQVADYVKEQALEIKKVMLDAQEQLEAYCKAAHGMKTAAKEAYIETHKELKHKFENYLGLYRKRAKDMRQLEFVNNRQKWLMRWARLIPLSLIFLHLKSLLD